LTTVAVENPLERLKVIGQTYLKFAIENPEFYDLMFVMRAPMAALKHRTSCGEADCDWQHGRRSYELLVNTIQECINQYLVRIPNAEEGALLAWSVVHGMATLLIRERFAMIELSDPEQKMEAVMDHLIRVMRI